MRETSQGESVHHRACNLCEAICGLEIRLDGDGRIASIRGDDADPLSRGHICPKAVALQDVQDDPDRLRRPLRRTDGGWEEIGWEAALDLAAEGIGAVQAEHGRDAVALYLGNPTVHNLGAMLFAPRLSRRLGTRNRFSATSVDQLPHHLAAHLLFGHQLLLPVPDLERTRHLLVLGANPLASNGSLMTAPGMRRRLREIAARGGRVVVVDPRRTETARLAERHLPIRPGTDALLLLAMVATLFEEGLVHLGPLEGLVDGVDELGSLAAPYPPERVADATGVPAAETRRLARELAAAGRDGGGVCYARVGLSTQPFGGLCQWLVHAANLLTGNLDREGGALLPRPAVDLVSRLGRGHFGRFSSRVRGLPEFAGELPVAALAEEIETPEGDPGEETDGGRRTARVRCLVTAAGNPVLSTPNGRRLERALGRLDFMVSIDLYLNETTRHADLVLPPTPPLEREHYDLVFHALAVRNTARWSEPLFPAAPDARHDWQILHGLERRLAARRASGAAGRLRTRLEGAALAALGPRRILDFLLRTGPYGAGWSPFGHGLTLARLAREPHGVDLGPLEPSLGRRLRERGRRIHLVPRVFRDDLPRLERFLAGQGAAGEGDDRPLLLVGRRQVRSNNSWMHNYERLMRGEDRCTLLVHPDDAARLGIADGEVEGNGTRPLAVVTSRVGRVEAPVEVSNEMMPGVVSLPHGWGHDRPGTRLRVAGERPGASVNDLTDDALIDELVGTAAFSGVAVTVEPAGGEGGR